MAEARKVTLCDSYNVDETQSGYTVQSVLNVEPVHHKATLTLYLLCSLKTVKS